VLQGGCQPPEGAFVEGAQVDLPPIVPVPRRHRPGGRAGFPVGQVTGGLSADEIGKGAS